MMFPLQDTVEWRFPFESSRCHLSLLLSWRQQMCRVGVLKSLIVFQVLPLLKKNLYSFKMDVLQTVSRVKHNRGTCYSYCYGWIGDSILRVCVLFITHGLLHLCTISPQKLALFEIWVSMLLVKLIYFGKHLVFIDIIELQQSQSIVF